MVLGGVIASVVVGFCALLLWGIAVAEWQASREPPRAHDPRHFLRGVTEPWGRPPVDLKTWMRMTRDEDTDPDVGVAEIVARLDGTYSDEGGGIDVTLRLRLLGREGLVVTRTQLGAPDHAAPGTFLPVRVAASGDAQGDVRVAPAENLSPAVTRRVLLAHRRELGVLDEDDHRVLAGDGRPERAVLIDVRPTGEVRGGHVEVRATVRVRSGETGETEGPGETHDVLGFLRPVELAAARHRQRLPVTRSDEGRWVLGPTWY